MPRAWEADPSALFVKRLGKSAKESGNSQGREQCPDIWQLSNGDLAVIGRDLTDTYHARLPEHVTPAADERLVVIPGNMLSLAKLGFPMLDVQPPALLPETAGGWRTRNIFRTSASGTRRSAMGTLELERLQHFEEAGSPSVTRCGAETGTRRCACSRRAATVCAESRRTRRRAARCSTACGWWRSR